MNDDTNDSVEHIKVTAEEDPGLDLFDPFAELFKVKPQAPGDYRSANDGRDF